MSENTPRQLLLGIKLDEDATFANYFDAGNEHIVAHLQDFPGIPEPRQIYLWGSAACGRTHLMQAACHHILTLGQGAVYLPLAEVRHLEPAILEGLESQHLVCLDDVHLLAEQGVGAKTAWEEALFRLLNRTRESGTIVILSADRPVLQLEIVLADLLSRLQSSTVFRLQEADDDGKLALLVFRADKLGFALAPQVAKFIIQRAGRSMPELMKVLDRIDSRSLEEKRAVTIPLIKSVMGW